MRILVDIGHPAHIHLFKNAANILKKNGHFVLFAVRNKEHALELATKYNFEYIATGHIYKDISKKILSALKLTKELKSIANKFKPDIFLSHGSMYNAFVSKMMGKPHICFEDTGNLEQIFLYKPFTNVILSPESLRLNLGKRHLKFRGYLELAYLHPKYFKPDISILNTLMVNEGEKFVIIRFSAQTATHDFGYAGIPLEYKIKCVEEFQKNAKVFISSEAHPGAYLEKFLIKIPPEKMPDALCYAALVYSEGAKTASEASLLGTPAIYVDFKGRDYTREQEKKYGTIFNFGSSKNDYKQSIQKGVDVLNKVNVKQEWREKRKKILNDNIDITAFMVWFIENYPESFAIIKKDPQYQFRFM